MFKMKHIEKSKKSTKTVNRENKENSQQVVDAVVEVLYWTAIVLDSKLNSYFKDLCQGNFNRFYTYKMFVQI